jgi:hypothetical protein
VSDAARRSDRSLEFIAVLLLGLATIGSAWSAYQSSSWNSAESRRAREASDLRVESARLFGLATQKAAYDATIVSQYAAAVAGEQPNLQEFYRKALVRKEFLPVLDRWQAQIAAGQDPANLLDDEEYVNAELAPSRRADQAAARADGVSHEAGDNADDYLLTALIMASSLFLAGVTTSFRAPGGRALLIAGAATMLAYGAARLADLPVA